MVARSVFVCFKPFSSVLYLRLFLAFSFLCVFVTLSLYWFLHFLLPCSADFICRKIEQRPKVNPCFFFVSPLFFSSVLFSSFSSTACLPNLTATQGWRKETPSVLCVFFSLLTAYLSCVFSYLSFFCFSPPLSPSRRGLYSLTCSSI